LGKEFMDEIKCPVCEGSRLKKNRFFFKKKYCRIVRMDISELNFGLKIYSHLSETKTIATEILKKLMTIKFYECCLNYWLSRSSQIAFWW
jgi:excinuclease ABC subunit A